MPTVYIETTVISYLTAWPSRDLVRAAHQQITREWWESRRPGFSLYASQLVLNEAASGYPKAAADRLQILAAFPLLEFRPPTLALAESLERALQLPYHARADALHVAVCAANGIDYLLTWNCRHLANATLAPKIERACLAHGLVSPRIVTPEQLLEEP
ncbi:MAG: type II toxin-antitoxin system VapC family toxin [Phycisphaerae bacterium]|nr:type II toxin-antitoxin system VapC family toxin [Phycisphaerae bacterium]